jgi:neuroligin
LAVVVLIHGESYSWGAGHLIDGGMLANKSRMVVVTLNYRLGILGISFSKCFLSFFLSK